MGLADITILTAEDPRTESLEGILAEMAGAAAGKGGVEGKSFYRVPDRGEAIRLGVKLAKAGDLVIACGKGHEQSMCFGETEYPWDDRTAMKAALAERLGIEGPGKACIANKLGNRSEEDYMEITASRPVIRTDHNKSRASNQPSRKKEDRLITSSIKKVLRFNFPIFRMHRCF